MRKARYLIPFTLLVLFSACQKESKKTLRIIASPTPHSEMLEFIIPELKKQGINLEVITLTDYLLPNKLIDEKEADANFFQHIPFLEYQKNEEHYNLEVLGKIHLEPMGIYSKNLEKTDNLSGKSIAIPLDPSNEKRALNLLEQAGLIILNSVANPTILDIKINPYNLTFIEVDSALLPRIFSDVDLAVIPTNFALQASLNPQKDALFLETGDSGFANVVVIHSESEKKEELSILLDCLKSEKMEEFIRTTYRGAIIPAE
jgi:D-methionine transport system substrate-binding protein